MKKSSPEKPRSFIIRCLMAMMLLLYSQAPPVMADEMQYYCRVPWFNLKTRIIPELIEKLEESYSLNSTLQAVSYKKYPLDEIKSVKNAVNTILPALTDEERNQVIMEVLSYHHVVYHETAWHHMDRNVQVCRTYEKLIEEKAALHKVPPAVVKAVITWENSGNTSSISYAACAGLGQMSQGAVDRAHLYGKDMSRYHMSKAKLFSFLYKTTGNDFYKREQIENARLAEEFKIAERHRYLAKKAGIDDERLVPECNAEDSVLFLKVLLDMYDDRPDFAIAAYHNGVTNMDDLIIDYMKRWLPWTVGSVRPERSTILQTLDTYKISYLTLWKDRRSREMLNGYRTMDGEITCASNKSEALADESDIYLWKVIAAYGALISPPESIAARIAEYQGRWDVVECRDLPVYRSVEEIRNAIKAGKLVKVPPVVKDLGIGSISGAYPLYDKEMRNLNYYVTPELAGFLYRLSEEIRASTGSRDIKTLSIPVSEALKSKVLHIAPHQSTAEKREHRTHLQGAAFDLPLSGSPCRELLYSIVNHYYLFDRIYLIYEGPWLHVCLNPRFGSEHYHYYCEYKAKKQKREH
ncbi:MAG: hypothetical protein AB2L14_13385 [Candidatus Xenobiia bacterium LiM19]